jgi:hypothetical protein
MTETNLDLGPGIVPTDGTTPIPEAQIRSEAADVVAEPAHEWVAVRYDGVLAEKLGPVDDDVLACTACCVTTTDPTSVMGWCSQSFTTCPLCGRVNGAHADGCVVGKLADVEAELQRSLVIKDELRTALEVAHAERRNAEHALSNFRDRVAETTAEWEHGCRSGKREFLEELGLDMPPRRWDVTATISFTVELDDDDQPSDRSFDEIITESWSGDAELHYIDVTNVDAA